MISPATKAALRENPNDSRHGSEHAYNGYACRCQRCRDAHALYARTYRARRRVAA